MFFSVILPTRHVDKLSMTVLKEEKNFPNEIVVGGIRWHIF